MNCAVIPAVAAAIFSVAAWASPLDLKGLSPGMVLADAEKAIPSLLSACRWTISKREPQYCMYTPGLTALRGPSLDALSTLAGIKVAYWSLTARAGAIAQASAVMHNAGHQQLILAMREKYGVETRNEASKIQNRAGASFDQEETTWERDAQVLTVLKRSGTIDKMSVTLTSKEEREAEEKERLESARKSSKDL